MNDDKTMEAAAITQADRDAGAAFWTFLGQHGSAKQCRTGKGFRATAQIFADHREAAVRAYLAQREADGSNP